MSDSYPLAGRAGYPARDAYAPPIWSDQRQHEGSGLVGLALFIWVPTLVAAAILAVAGQVVIGLLLLAAACVLHSMFQPIAAVYALIAVIPVNWLVTVIPQMTTGGKLVGVLALLVSLPRLISRVTSGRWDRCAKWMVILLLWTAVSCAWAPYPNFSFTRWLSVSMMWGIPVLICLHMRTRSSVRFALFLLVISCVIGSVAIVVTNNPTKVVSQGAERGKASAVLGAADESANDAGNAARLLAIGVIASVYLIVTTTGNVKRALLAAAILVMALAILLLKSRATYIGLPMALTGGVLALKGAGIGRRILLVVLPGLLGAVTTFGVLKLGFMGKGIEQRFDSIFEQGVEAGNRNTIWLAHVRVFFTTGFRGAGLSSMQFRAESTYRIAHNDWLSMAGELGAIGLIAFIGFHLTLFRRMRVLGDIRGKMFCLMAWMFIILAAMTATNWQHKNYTLVIGLILAVVRLHEAESTRSPYPEAALRK